MFWIWALLDCIATDSAMCRNLPKPMWIILILILPDIGALVWLLLGRPERASWRPGSTDYAAPRRPVGLEDSPRYSALADDHRPPLGGAQPRARALGARAEARSDERAPAAASRPSPRPRRMATRARPARGRAPAPASSSCASVSSTSASSSSTRARPRRVTRRPGSAQAAGTPKRRCSTAARSRRRRAGTSRSRAR